MKNLDIDRLESAYDEGFVEWQIEDQTCGAQAETNCCAWGPANIERGGFTWHEGKRAISFSYELLGEQDEDRTYCGTEISGEGVFLLDDGYPVVVVQTQILDNEEDPERESSCY